MLNRPIPHWTPQWGVSKIQKCKVEIEVTWCFGRDGQSSSPACTAACPSFRYAFMLSSCSCPCFSNRNLFLIKQTYIYMIPELWKYQKQWLVMPVETRITTFSEHFDVIITQISWSRLVHRKPSGQIPPWLRQAAVNFSYPLGWSFRIGLGLLKT